MNIRNLLYEILYSGFVMEKGSHKKCGASLKRFTAHLKLWNVISLALSTQTIDDICFSGIISLIKSDKNLYRLYFPHLESKIISVNYTFTELSDGQLKVQNFMIRLLIILNLQFSGKYSDDLHTIVRGLHNLPRCFLTSLNSEKSQAYAIPNSCMEYSYMNLGANFISHWLD